MGDRRTLAQGAVTRVEVCDCGSCYLTIGPITISLQPTVIDELADCIRKAARLLRLEQGVDAHSMASPTKDTH